MVRISERQQFVSVSELFRNKLRLYQNHLSLFGKVMLPIFILSLILDISYYCGICYVFPNSTWEVSTSNGLTVYTDLTHSLNFQFSSFISIFTWFALSMLVLTTYKLYRGYNVSFQEIWQQSLQKKGTIFGAGLLCVVVVISFLIFLLVLSGLIGFTLTIIGFFSFFIYFGVRMCLVHQCIIIENLTTLKAFQRSSELINGNFLKFFGRLLLLLWISNLLFNSFLALTLFIISFISTDLVPIRESILSGEFLTLFYGIPISFYTNDINLSVGNISMSFPETPSFWIIAVISLVKTFVYALLTPLWAILTTHLYLEQTEGGEISGETHVEAIEAQI